MKLLQNLIVSLAVVIALAGGARADLIDVFATSFPGGNPTLETIDLVTGHVHPLGTVNWGGMLNDIAQDPTSGTLYGLSGANLFTISTSGNIGAVTLVATAGMSGSMETLAFNSAGDLYIGSQSSLYKFNFSNPTRLAGTAAYVGSYDSSGNDPYLNGAGQNLRFNGNTLYVANTGSGNNTELYTVNPATGGASFIGVVTNQPSLVLGNHGTHMYGSSVPAINGGNATADLLDFGSTITTYLGNNPLGGNGQLPIVNYTTLLAGNVGGNFPLNANFTEAGSVAAVPEPGVGMLFGLGLVGIVALRYRTSKRDQQPAPVTVESA